MQVALLREGSRWSSTREPWKPAIYASYYKGKIGKGETVQEAIANNPFWRTKPKVKKKK